MNGLPGGTRAILNSSRAHTIQMFIVVVPMLFLWHPLNYFGSNFAPKESDNPALSILQSDINNYSVANVTKDKFSSILHSVPAAGLSRTFLGLFVGGLAVQALWAGRRGASRNIAKTLIRIVKTELGPTTLKKTAILTSSILGYAAYDLGTYYSRIFQHGFDSYQDANGNVHTRSKGLTERRYRVIHQSLIPISACYIACGIGGTAFGIPFVMALLYWKINLHSHAATISHSLHELEKIECEQQ